MVRMNQKGASGVGLSLVISVVLLIIVFIFAVWAFSGRQDYKNNVDAKISTAVQAAKKQEDALNTKQFAEQSKSPLVTYNGPEAYGSISLSYPKTWSGYVDDTGSGSALVDGYFTPGVVPALNNQASVYALRVQIIDTSYSQTVQNLSNQQQNGGLTISAYSLPKLKQVVGIEATGQLNSSSTATTTMVVLPLRSDTIEIYTQGSQYLSDFNTYILPNFSFSP